MNDELGTRIKEQYENRTRYMLPRRTYTLLRLDGAHFHTYTKGLKKPFDGDLMQDIDNAIIEMIEMLETKGIKLDHYFSSERFGRLIVKEEYLYDLTLHGIDFMKDGNVSVDATGITKTRWISKPAWKFVENRDEIFYRIPNSQVNITEEVLMELEK